MKSACKEYLTVLAHFASEGDKSSFESTLGEGIVRMKRVSITARVKCVLCDKRGTVLELNVEKEVGKRKGM